MVVITPVLVLKNCYHLLIVVDHYLFPPVLHTVSVLLVSECLSVCVCLSVRLSVCLSVFVCASVCVDYCLYVCMQGLIVSIKSVCICFINNQGQIFKLSFLLAGMLIKCLQTLTLIFV